MNKEIVKKVCARCGAETEELDSSNYCKDCRKDYNKQYKQQIQDNFIYLFVDADLKPLYLGSCMYLGIRVSDHLNGHSHLKRNRLDWKALELHNIEYAILDVDSREERLYIEKYLIRQFEPRLNYYEPIAKGITEERKKELEQQADNLIFRTLDLRLFNNL